MIIDEKGLTEAFETHNVDPSSELAERIRAAVRGKRQQTVDGVNPYGNRAERRASKSKAGGATRATKHRGVGRAR